MYTREFSQKFRPRKQTIGQFQRRKPQKQIAIREGSATLIINRFRRFPRASSGSKNNCPRNTAEEQKQKKKEQEQNFRRTHRKKKRARNSGKRLEMPKGWGGEREEGGTGRGRECGEAPSVLYVFPLPFTKNRAIDSATCAIFFRTYRSLCAPNRNIYRDVMPQRLAQVGCS